MRVGALVDRRWKIRGGVAGIGAIVGGCASNQLQLDVQLFMRDSSVCGRNGPPQQAGPTEG
jgi:hypothetical protein